MLFNCWLISAFMLPDQSIQIPSLFSSQVYHLGSYLVFSLFFIVPWTALCNWLYVMWQCFCCLWFWTRTKCLQIFWFVIHSIKSILLTASSCITSTIPYFDFFFFFFSLCCEALASTRCLLYGNNFEDVRNLSATSSSGTSSCSCS